MKRKIGNGALAGILAGVVFGVMMQMMKAPTPDGTEVPMMVMVAQIVGSTSLAVGWIYHLFNSAIIGGIFGWFLGNPSDRYSQAMIKGAIYGFVWWILGGLLLMPLFLGMPAFAPLRMEQMRSVAWGSLMGHLIYGFILGAGYIYVEHVERRRAQPQRPATSAPR